MRVLSVVAALLFMVPEQSCAEAIRKPWEQSQDWLRCSSR